MCERVFTIFSWPRWLIDLKLLQVCQLMYMIDYIMCFKCQQQFCHKNQFCTIPLIKKRCVDVHVTCCHEVGCWEHISWQALWRVCPKEWSGDFVKYCHIFFHLVHSFVRFGGCLCPASYSLHLLGCHWQPLERSDKPGGRSRKTVGWGAVV